MAERRSYRHRTLLFDSMQLADKAADAIQQKGGLILKMQTLKNGKVKVVWTDY